MWLGLATWLYPCFIKLQAFLICSCNSQYKLAFIRCGGKTRPTMTVSGQKKAIIKGIVYLIHRPTWYHLIQTGERHPQTSLGLHSLGDWSCPQACLVPLWWVNIWWRNGKEREMEWPWAVERQRTEDIKAWGTVPCCHKGAMMTSGAGLLPRATSRLVALQQPGSALASVTTENHEDAQSLVSYPSPC